MNSRSVFPDEQPDDSRSIRIKDTIIDELVTRVVPWIGKSEHKTESQLTTTLWSQLLDDIDAYLRETTDDGSHYVISNEGYLDRHLYRRDDSLHATISYEYPSNSGRPAIELEIRSYANNYTDETVSALEASLGESRLHRQPHLADLDAIERIVRSRSGVLGRRISARPRWV